jgi:hypothetical protein
MYRSASASINTSTNRACSYSRMSHSHTVLGNGRPSTINVLAAPQPCLATHVVLPSHSPNRPSELILLSDFRSSQSQAAQSQYQASVESPGQECQYFKTLRLSRNMYLHQPIPLFFQCQEVLEPTSVVHLRHLLQTHLSISQRGRARK